MKIVLKLGAVLTYLLLNLLVSYIWCKFTGQKWEITI